MADEAQTENNILPFQTQLSIIDTLLNVDRTKMIMETFDLDEDKKELVEAFLTFIHSSTMTGFRASHPLGLIDAMIHELRQRYPSGAFFCVPEFNDDETLVTCLVKYDDNEYTFMSEPVVRLQQLLIRFMRNESELDAQAAADIQQGIVEGEVLDVMTSDVDVSDSLDNLTGDIGPTEELQ